jgi:hypothetical protein
MKQYYMAPQLAVYHIAPLLLLAESKVKDDSDDNKLNTEDILTKKSDNWNLWGSDDDE